MFDPIHERPYNRRRASIQAVWRALRRRGHADARTVRDPGRLSDADLEALGVDATLEDEELQLAVAKALADKHGIPTSR